MIPGGGGGGGYLAYPRPPEKILSVFKNGKIWPKKWHFLEIFLGPLPPKKKILAGLMYVLNHRRTRVENPGERVVQIFAKIPEGGLVFQENLHLRYFTL